MFLLQISFVRKKDFHILSNGHHIYTSDKRFEIIHAAKSDDWILQISKVGYADSGIYECQVKKLIETSFMFCCLFDMKWCGRLKIKGTYV